MAQKNLLRSNNIHTFPLGRTMVVGATIALILIVLFLLPVQLPKREWGKLWMVRPLVIVPIAGAMGGVAYYLLDNLRRYGGWRKDAANILSVILYIIGLWTGTVLGLDGSMWN